MANSRNACRIVTGVITAPRDHGYYLDKTLESLTRAGFSDITVFAEPRSLVPEGFKKTFRPKTYGDWTNWATGLYELLLSNPESDAFLMCEDDAIFCKDTEKYLQHAIPQLGEFGSLSLYTPSIYKRQLQGFHNEQNDLFTWSTVAILMKKQQVISFFSDSQVQKHRFEDIFDKPDSFWGCNKTSPRNSIKDAVIGNWAARCNLAIYYHTPSLAEHIGENSTITTKHCSLENGRISANFIGEDADLSEWLERPVKMRKMSKVAMA